MRYLLAAVLVANCASAQEIYSKPEVKPVIDLCNITGLYNQATQSKVGQAWVTNYHVITNCPEKVIAYDSIRDLALLARGDPPEDCKNPKLEDTVISIGIKYEGLEEWSIDAVYGRVKHLRHADLVKASTYEKLGEIHELVVSQDAWIVKWGFSGGTIYDANTNRTVGILNASNRENVHGIPIKIVCQFIEYGNKNTGEAWGKYAN